MTKVLKESKPTIRQKQAFKVLTKKIAGEKPFTMGEVMVTAGYSPASAVNPEANLLSKPGFQALLTKIDDDHILSRIYGILLDDDKRASLQAADMLLKLKDRYPAGKLKVTQYNDELSQF
jgi:hypothetical protein